MSPFKDMTRQKKSFFSNFDELRENGMYLVKCFYVKSNYPSEGIMASYKYTAGLVAFMLKKQRASFHDNIALTSHVYKRENKIFWKENLDSKRDDFIKLL